MPPVFETREKFVSLYFVVKHVCLNAEFSSSAQRTLQASRVRTYDTARLRLPDVEPAALDALKAREIAKSLSFECAGCFQTFAIATLTIDRVQPEGTVSCEGQQWAFRDLLDCPFCKHADMRARLADTGILTTSFQLRDYTPGW